MSVENEKDLEKSFTESILAEMKGLENPLKLLEDLKIRIEKMLNQLDDNDDIVGREELLLYCRVQLKVVKSFIKEELKK